MMFMVKIESMTTVQYISCNHNISFTLRTPSHYKALQPRLIPLWLRQDLMCGN